jgi:hypothetical protein
MNEPNNENEPPDKMAEGAFPCDLCGCKDPNGKILKFHDFIYLCPNCLNKMEACPEGVRFPPKSRQKNAYVKL